VGRTAPESPVTLLENLAELLCACEKAQMNIKLRHGIIYSKIGYVLPTDAGWVARTLLYAPFSDDEDEDS
jgi:hypothetical protein